MDSLIGLALFPLLPLLNAVGPAYPAFPPLPATFAQKLECAAPENANLDRPIPFRCAISPEIQATTVLLYFRQGGAKDFTPAPTLRTDRGWHVAWLCSHDVSAGPVQYYFEARDAGGRVVATNGDEDNPSVMLARGGGATATTVGTFVTPTEPSRRANVDDHDPLAAVRRSQAQSRNAELRAQRRSSGVFVGASVGVGHGYFPERGLEFHKELATEPDFGSAGLPVFLPELGYEFDGGLALSLQLRWQPLPSEGSGDPLAGRPAGRSYAVMARAQYLFDATAWQPFVSGNVGVGDGFRVVVPARPTEGLARDDTVRGGPLVVGPGVGTLFHFNRHLAAIGELRVLAGVPKFAIIGELALGLQVAF